MIDKKLPKRENFDMKSKNLLIEKLILNIFSSFRSDAQIGSSTPNHNEYRMNSFSWIQPGQQAHHAPVANDGHVAASIPLPIAIQLPHQVSGIQTVSHSPVPGYVPIIEKPIQYRDGRRRCRWELSWPEPKPSGCPPSCPNKN